jgi:hypothetical protein
LENFVNDIERLEAKVDALTDTVRTLVRTVIEHQLKNQRDHDELRGELHIFAEAAICARSDAIRAVDVANAASERTSENLRVTHRDRPTDPTPRNYSSAPPLVSDEH